MKSGVSNMRRIVHVDINSYFATILQQENPYLRGKPVGVVKSAGRHCIIAASKEAKALGIKTGEMLRDALVKAPNLITIPAHFGIYLDCTHKLKKVFTDISPVADIFSLDEAFLDLTGCENVIPNLMEYGKYIQQQIKLSLGEWVTCNVGIAPNKLLAKMIGEVSPKGSVNEVTAENLDQLLLTTKFSDVCGVGFRLEKKLHRLGIFSPYMIRLLSDDTLLANFGPFWSHQLRLISRGEETHFFTHPPRVDHMQSVGRTITGYKLEDDERIIKCTLLNLLEEATHKVRKMHLAGRKIGISLWGLDHYWSAHRTLNYWVRHTSEIFPLLYDQMYRSWHRYFPVIKYGVWIGDLRPLDSIPQSLFPEDHRRELLSLSIDKINHRYGNFTIMPATLLASSLIRPEVTGFLGDKTYHGL